MSSEAEEPTEIIEDRPPGYDIRESSFFSSALREAQLSEAKESVVVGRRYVPGLLIARGGMGEVQLALDRQLGRKVALKKLRSHLQDQPGAIHRFVREAHITAQLQHPGIVPVHELGQSAGKPFFTMKHVEGRTLHELILALAEGHEKLALARRVRLIVQVAQALRFAHSRGVLHRDLKPENIMIGAFGEVLVMDWGLARVIGEPEAADPERVDLEIAGDTPHDTRAGQVLGTPRYMSPEQARGELQAIDLRSDIYGLGVLLSCCLALTTAGPRRGSTVDLEVGQRRPGPPAGRSARGPALPTGASRDRREGHGPQT